MWEWVMSHKLELVGIAGGIIIAARIIVKLTPTPKDDTVLAAIVKILRQLGLNLPPDEKKDDSSWQ